MKYDKGFWITSAVYKMLKQKRINPEDAIRLMIERGKTRPHTARACVELWLRWPLKDIWK